MRARIEELEEHVDGVMEDEKVLSRDTLAVPYHYLSRTVPLSRVTESYRSLVSRSLVSRSLVSRSLVCCSLVSRSISCRSLVCRSLVCRSLPVPLAMSRDGGGEGGSSPSSYASSSSLSS